jgi:hypothetical protein
MTDQIYPASMARLERAVTATSIQIRNERLRALRLDLDRFEAEVNRTKLERSLRPFDIRILQSARPAAATGASAAVAA